MDLQRELEISKKAAIEAGLAIMDIYNNAEDMQITYKDGDMPLTAADKASNKIIVGMLKKNFQNTVFYLRKKRMTKAVLIMTIVLLLTRLMVLRNL